MDARDSRCHVEERRDVVGGQDVAVGGEAGPRTAAMAAGSWAVSTNRGSQ